VLDCDGQPVDTTGLVAFEFAGTIDDVSSFPFPGGDETSWISAPSAATGWYAFDPTVEPYAAVLTGQYRFLPNQFKAFVWVTPGSGPATCLGPMSSYDNLGGYAGEIELVDDYPSSGPEDRYVVHSVYLQAPGDPPDTFTTLYLALNTGAGAVISGLALPLTPPDLNDFSTADLILETLPSTGIGHVTSLSLP